MALCDICLSWPSEAGRSGRGRGSLLLPHEMDGAGPRDCPFDSPLRPPRVRACWLALSPYPAPAHRDTADDLPAQESVCPVVFVSVASHTIHRIASSSTGRRYGTAATASPAFPAPGDAAAGRTSRRWRGKLPPVAAAADAAATRHAYVDISTLVSHCRSHYLHRG